MSNTPAELKYASSHEWARLEEDGTVTVGISDHAQNALGDVVFVRLGAKECFGPRWAGFRRSSEHE